MKVLVTGGTGTISSGIVKESVRNGFETYALTRGNNSYRNIEGATYLHADVWDKEAVRHVVGGLHFDVVVECIVYNVEQLKVSLDNYADKCGQYIFVSSCAVYTPNSDKLIKESDEKAHFEWSYSKEKIECEDYLIDYCNKTGLKYTIIRPAVTYGDYRVPFPIATRNPAWTFFQRLKDGKPMLACDNVRNHVMHIEDFSRAAVMLFSNEKAFNEDFHIVTDEVIYWDDVIKIAAEILGVESKIIHVPLEKYKVIYPQVYDEIRESKAVSQYYDNTKLKSVIPMFEYKISIDAGIRLIIKNMQAEFEKQNLSLDDDWNRKCDSTIIYAYNKAVLSDEEMRYVETYFSDMSKRETRNLNNYIRVRLIKQKIKAIKAKIMS
jgi:nucleoside-diphosphate-sugar epimerase